MMDEYGRGDFSCGAELLGDGCGVLRISGEFDMYAADDVNAVY